MSNYHSVKNKIEKSNAKLRRKLFDNNIKVMGDETEILRITLVQDPDFPDDNEMVITDKGKTQVIIELPGEDISVRDTDSNYGTQLDTSQDNLSLYDILPIPMWSKFSDELKKGDIIVYKIYNDKDVPSPYIFQITRKYRRFNRVSTYTRFDIAFYHLDLSQEVRNLIDDYMNDERF